MNDNSIQKSIGSAGAMMMIRVVNESHKGIRLCFIDAMNFCAPGTTLKKMAQEYGGVTNIKGVFPYEIVNTKTYQEVLGSKEILPITAFYNNLKKEDISVKESIYYTDIISVKCYA